MHHHEFGRTIASAPAAGVEPEGDAEKHNGENLIIDSEKMYGFHGHFSSGNQMLFFGGGFKGGYVYGKTAPRHPMIPVENPVKLSDAHATIYKALGIANHPATPEARPFYVTDQRQRATCQCSARLNKVSGIILQFRRSRPANILITNPIFYEYFFNSPACSRPVIRLGSFIKVIKVTPRNCVSYLSL